MISVDFLLEGFLRLLYFVPHLRPLILVEVVAEHGLNEIHVLVIPASRSKPVEILFHVIRIFEV